MIVCSFTAETNLISLYQETLELSDLNFALLPYDSQDSDCAKIWSFNIYLSDDHNKQSIIDFIKSIAKQFKLEEPTISFSELESKDWVTEVQKDFKPLRIENICIYSPYYHDIVDTQDKKTIYINIDPGNAFGTGEHHTTQACLKAISKLSTHNFERMLDLGCGSAVLAIALAKIFNKHVIACDIDEDAVTVAQNNIEKNNVATLVRALKADGIQNSLITQTAPYELIVCNILANVLIDLAPDLNLITAKTGIIILSGLTTKQLNSVESAYHKCGFITLEIIVQDEWCAVMLKKPGY